MAKVNLQTFNMEGQNYYYIHRHLNHFEKDAAIASFQEQKKINYQIMKNRFFQNYKESFNDINSNALNLLDSAMREEEINDLDKILLDTLNDNISEAIKNTGLNEKINIAYNSLNDFIKTQDAKSLDKLFSQITSATELLTTSRGELVALIGQKGEFKKHRDLTKLYNALQSDLNSLEGKVLTVNQNRLKSVEESLTRLVGDLSNKKFDKQVLTGYLKNIFSTQIGEYVVSKGIGKAIGLGLKEIRDSLSGSENIEVEEDEELKNLIEKFGQQGSQVFKTDNSFKDLSININSNEDSININLGISTKWYKESSSGKVYDVHIATEKSFLHRVNQLFSDTLNKYYVYNSFGLVNQDDSLYSALKAAIVARNLDVLISGLGAKEDFSQFLVINGNFYSIWQIILAIENYNQGEGSFGKGLKTDPITISATGLSNVTNLTEQVKNDPSNLNAAFLRSKKQNQLIENLGLSAHFYPNRLKNILISK